MRAGWPLLVSASLAWGVLPLGADETHAHDELTRLIQADAQAQWRAFAAKAAAAAKAAPAPGPILEVVEMDPYVVRGAPIPVVKLPPRQSPVITLLKTGKFEHVGKTTTTVLDLTPTSDRSGAAKMQVQVHLLW